MRIEILGPLVSLMCVIAACESEDPALEYSAPEAQQKEGANLQRVSVLDENGELVDPIDVELSWEEKSYYDEILLVDETDSSIHEKASPSLSSNCSIPSTVYNSVAYSEGSPTGSATCYGYTYFGGDNEPDCYIKFKGAGKYSKYYYDDVNSCAREADIYYWGELAAYYDSSGNAYLRMDDYWCKKMDCENGFKIGH